MRKWIIWSFERGSFQYDVLCGLILIVIFLIPPSAFNDRPDYLRIPPPGEVHRVLDDDGNPVYTVQVEGAASEAAARERLGSFLADAGPVRIAASEPVYDTRGGVAAYSFWLRDDRDEDN